VRPFAGSLCAIAAAVKRREPEVVVSFDNRNALWSFVVPAQAGIHKEIDEKKTEMWIPACAGMTNDQGQPSNDTSTEPEEPEVVR
jgi:hypothetical protein